MRLVRPRGRDEVRTGRVYNIGTGRQTTIAEMVAIARRLFGVTAEPRWGSMPDRPWDTTVWVTDPLRAERELGWHPLADLETGLTRTAEWLQAR